MLSGHPCGDPSSPRHRLLPVGCPAGAYRVRAGPFVHRDRHPSGRASGTASSSIMAPGGRWRDRRHRQPCKCVSTRPSPWGAKRFEVGRGGGLAKGCRATPSSGGRRRGLPGATILGRVVIRAGSSIGGNGSHPRGARGSPLPGLFAAARQTHSRSGSMSGRHTRGWGSRPVAAWPRPGPSRPLPDRAGLSQLPTVVSRGVVSLFPSLATTLKIGRIGRCRSGSGRRGGGERTAPTPRGEHASPTRRRYSPEAAREPRPAR